MNVLLGHDIFYVSNGKPHSLKGFQMAFRKRAHTFIYDVLLNFYNSFH